MADFYPFRKIFQAGWKSVFKKETITSNRNRSLRVINFVQNSVCSENLTEWKSVVRDVVSANWRGGCRIISQ